MVAGERIEIALLPRPSLEAAPEEIPLDILYEDKDLLVLNAYQGTQICQPAEFISLLDARRRDSQT